MDFLKIKTLGEEGMLLAEYQKVEEAESRNDKKLVLRGHK